MSVPVLSRKALGRVVTSLLKSEIGAAGPAFNRDVEGLMAADAWPETLRIGGTEPAALPLDSLDLLRLTAAVNEMFHLYEGKLEGDLFSAGTFGGWLDSIEAAWAKGVTRLTFMTSGSTGKPKRCTHESSHLETEIRYLTELFADRQRIIPLTPAHHIYGFLFTAMLPDRLAPHSASFDAKLGSLSNLQAGDLVVTFPERWQWLHRTVAQWPHGVAGVVSTAPCPPDLIAKLMEQGLQSFTEVYGSSETLGLGIRRWPETHYRFMPHWKVCDTTAENGVRLTHTSGDEVRVQDRLELFEDGSFTVSGRIDAAVQVGGVNVYPERIAALLRDRPGVRDAVVRLDTFDKGGRLKAFVVAQQDADPAELRLRLTEWANSALSSVERPQSFTFGDLLPKTAQGKNSDW